MVLKETPHKKTIKNFGHHIREEVVKIRTFWDMGEGECLKTGKNLWMTPTCNFKLQGFSGKFY